MSRPNDGGPGPEAAMAWPACRAAAGSLALTLALLLAACGSGGGADADLPPETTEFKVTTSMRLSFQVRGAGGTSSFALPAAPEGMLIDAATGEVEWTPRPDQIGEHDVAVAVTDGSGAVVGKTYRIVVSAPEGEGAYMVLGTDGVAYRPGQAIALRWRIGGDLPPRGSIEIGADAPAVDAAAAEGSPTAWTLAAQGTWSASPVRYQDAARAGQASLVLPNGLTGHWILTARLLDDDGTPLAAMSARVLVADVPTLKLRLNRTIANPLDTVKAMVDVAAGAAPVATRLAAWMVLPDGRKLGLPSLDPGELEVNRDETASGRHVLLERDFTADEAGDYRLLVRLYAADDGRLLQEAGSRFSVCAATSTLSGRVLKPDRSPADGTAMPLAAVMAFDVDDGGVTDTAEVARDGGYTLNLPPGRYLVRARALDAAGVAFEADAAPVLVGCTPAPLARDLQLRSR